MAQRTNKQRRGTGYKFSGSKTGKKGLGEKRKTWQYKKVRSLSTEKALEEGIIQPIENPNGKVYHWFRHGEKKCWDTKRKFDPEGYDRWGTRHPKAYKFIKMLKSAATKFELAAYQPTGQLV